MALSPWPEDATDLAAAKTALAAALPDGADVARLGPVAAALVEEYSPGAPQPIRDEAVIRCSGWLYESTPGLADSKLSAGPVEVSRTFAPGYSALRHSGAMALLSRWKVRRAGRIG